jgi:hypothetical protein
MPVWRTFRAGKDTGLHNLPFHDMAQNQIWVALAADLLAWTACLALPATAATYEPKRLRLRILAVAARIVTTARRWILKIDPAWPWDQDTITIMMENRGLEPIIPRESLRERGTREVNVAGEQRPPCPVGRTS